MGVIAGFPTTGSASFDTATQLSYAARTCTYAYNLTKDKVTAIN